MSDLTDDILEGACCELCGEYFDEPTGSPTTCDACKRQQPSRR